MFSLGSKQRVYQMEVRAHLDSRRTLFSRVLSEALHHQLYKTLLVGGALCRQHLKTLSLAHKVSKQLHCQ